MNRDHVGMIFKFLPKEEQEELQKLPDIEKEVYRPEKGCWYNLKSLDDNDMNKSYWFVSLPYENLACRPKGFLSWFEIHEDFDKMYLGKRIRQLVSEYPSTHSFVHKEWLYQNRIRYTDSCLTPNYAYPDLSRKDYGFEVVQ